LIQSGSYPLNLRKIALVGNFLPRRCGIATFTADLLTAVAQEDPFPECWAVVMNDIPEGYDYPPPVRFEVNQRLLSDYHLAADFLNMNRVDVVCLQHEFGIFGGNNGVHILELLKHLRMPLVSTLHTVLESPAPEQRSLLKHIARLSDRLVVMSFKAKAILEQTYEIPGKKIVMIPHGIPDVPFVDPNFYKDQFGVEGRKVILTFGLISPGKGIETMIDALPRVVQKHPEVVYIILGATHPHIKKEQGEAYRLSLQRRARDLGIEEHLVFHNRFVDLQELCEFLGAADIYVTPYLNREQIVSGTLAYALGSGKATVSTPYWYAEEMLAENRGKLVPFQDPAALAQAIRDLLDHEVECHAMRKRAYTFCREMVWKEVARRYLHVFNQVKKERESQPRPVFWMKTMEALPREIPPPKMEQILRLTDDVGMLQHANFIVPNRFHGYCTDDNARALIAVLMAQDVIADNTRLADLACRYISFLYHAFNDAQGRFRNFMGFDRRWQEDVGSEDSHARAVWSLGEAAASSESEDLRDAAQLLFEKALPVLLSFESPRAWAFALVGIHSYLQRFSGDSEVRRLRQKLSRRLFELYQANAQENWPWIEDTVTYANGKITQALILSGWGMNREDMLEAGLRSLEWLIFIQTDPKGHFVPIGNNGWFPRGGSKARFDQQPIEAMGIIEACRGAYTVTGDPKWLKHAQTCMEWFLGRNDLNVPLYDHKTGGCNDGLQADGPNRNQGGESTLACFISLLNMYRLRSLQVSKDTPVKMHQKVSGHGG